MKFFLVGLCLLTGVVFADDFFGISFSSSPEKDFEALFESLLDGNISAAESYIRHLESIRPELAGKISISDFKIPVLASSHPPASTATQTCLDPDALHYMKDLFFTALEENHSFKSAWKTMQKRVAQRVQLAPSRRAFKGKVLLLEIDGILVKESETELLFLSTKSLETIQKGDSLEGYCWKLPGLSYSYEIAPEKFKAVDLYTDSLWWDY
jgi:hypothetical protein